jgi:hypothetical protein
VLLAKTKRVDLDADLEKEENDADVSKSLQLLTVRDIPGREGRNDKPGSEVPDDGWQPEPPCRPTRSGCQEEDEADLEHIGRRSVHTLESVKPRWGRVSVLVGRGGSVRDD